ncbi:MAG: hypothetical protein COA69_10580 [Robiginitomaculum sp.]|nr:MAG: hypothetical protein COA69_10580 [Robiginitomaculum sp.]
MDKIVERAETKSQNRAYLLLLLALVLVVNVVFLFGTNQGSRQILWLAMNGLVALNLTGFPFWGFGRRGSRLCLILNDETTQLFRLKSFMTGFWITLGVAIFLMLVMLYQPISGIDVSRILITTALVSALVSYSVFELRAYR